MTKTRILRATAAVLAVSLLILWSVYMARYGGRYTWARGFGTLGLLWLTAWVLVLTEAVVPLGVRVGGRLRAIESTFFRSPLRFFWVLSVLSWMCFCLSLVVAGLFATFR